MSPESRWIWQFGHPPVGSATEVERMLGGKGAALSRMTRAGLPVPPGFTISIKACQAYWTAGRQFPDSLCAGLREAVAQIEKATGTRYGVGPRPLLLAVRSGARHSMPGLMTTLLNCGLKRSLVESHVHTDALANAFAKFIGDFARAKYGIEVGDPNYRPSWQSYLERYQQLVGESFPDEPWQQLKLCVGAVFDSWNNQRAVQYRTLRGIRDSAGTAVNVQAMVPVQLSGLLFSQDPLKRERSAWVVEVAPGLGDQLAAGQLTPQRFYVDRDIPAEFDGGSTNRERSQPPHRTAAERSCCKTGGRTSAEPASLAIPAGREPCSPESDAAATHPLLTQGQLDELCKLGRELEQEFGCLVDVEWGMQDGRFVLFQARRQERYDVALRRDACVDRELARLRNAAREGRIWVRHNLAESVPAPTPLTWDILRQYMSGRGGFGDLYRDLGYAPSRFVCRTGFLELVFGQIYADPHHMAEMFCAGLPLSYDLERLRKDTSLLERAPDKLDAKATDASFLLRLPHIFWVLLRAGRRTKRMMRSAQQQFEQQVVPEFGEYVARERSIDLEQLDISELLKCLDARRAAVLDHFAPALLKPGLFGGLAFVRFEGNLSRLLGEAKGQRMARALVQGLEADWRSGPEAWLQSSSDLSMSEFLDRFGHRAIGEMELANPRWHEDSASLERLLTQRASGVGDASAGLFKKTQKRRVRAETRLPTMLAAHGASSLVESIQQELAVVKQLLPYREIGKHYLMEGYDLIRQVIQVLADRLQLGTDIYFLEVAELHRCGAGLPLVDDVHPSMLTEQRRFQWQVLQRVSLPDFVDADSLEHVQRRLPSAGDEGWMDATALSNGVARGPILRLDDHASVDLRQTGYVLVCTALDSGLTALMSGACALVVERGGILSHGAAVARQLGIPAVALANWRLEGAKWLVVDGSRGRVKMERGA